VALIDQGVAQVGHHPLGSPVKTRRHGLIKRGDLSDFHGAHPFMARNGRRTKRSPPTAVLFPGDARDGAALDATPATAPF
jgi:hypothetical protein